MRRNSDANHLNADALRPPNAFTLMEMLVVVAIISLLAAAAVPQFFSVMKATRLTSAGDALLSRIAQAQQAALATNSQVELRIYRFSDDATYGGGEDSQFKAMQVVNPMGRSGSGGSFSGGGNEEASSQGASESQAISEPYRMQGGVIFASSDRFSPLLGSTVKSKDEGGSGTLESAEYAALRFYPDGSFKQVKSSEKAEEGKAQRFETGAVTPELRQSFLTIADEADLEKGDVPKNFVCIQIDPYTGKARVYRP